MAARAQTVKNKIRTLKPCCPSSHLFLLYALRDFLHFLLKSLGLCLDLVLVRLDELEPLVDCVNRLGDFVFHEDGTDLLVDLVVWCEKSKLTLDHLVLGVLLHEGLLLLSELGEILLLLLENGHLPVHNRSYDERKGLGMSENCGTVN